jgi:hypothetical protein
MWIGGNGRVVCWNCRARGYSRDGMGIDWRDAGC